MHDLIHKSNTIIVTNLCSLTLYLQHSYYIKTMYHISVHNQMFNALSLFPVHLTASGSHHHLLPAGLDLDHITVVANDL